MHREKGLVPRFIVQIFLVLQLIFLSGAATSEVTEDKFGRILKLYFDTQPPQAFYRVLINLDAGISLGSQNIDWKEHSKSIKTTQQRVLDTLYNLTKTSEKRFIVQLKAFPSLIIDLTVPEIIHLSNLKEVTNIELVVDFHTSQVVGISDWDFEVLEGLGVNENIQNTVSEDNDVIIAFIDGGFREHQNYMENVKYAVHVDNDGFPTLGYYHHNNSNCKRIITRHGTRMVTMAVGKHGVSPNSGVWLYGTSKCFGGQHLVTGWGTIVSLDDIALCHIISEERTSECPMIISMSFGISYLNDIGIIDSQVSQELINDGPTSDDHWAPMIRWLANHWGITVFAATGNFYSMIDIDYPAYIDDAVAVGAYVTYDASSFPSVLSIKNAFPADVLSETECELESIKTGIDEDDDGIDDYIDVDFASDDVSYARHMKRDGDDNGIDDIFELNKCTPANRNVMVNYSNYAEGLVDIAAPTHLLPLPADLLFNFDDTVDDTADCMNVPGTCSPFTGGTSAATAIASASGAMVLSWAKEHDVFDRLFDDNGKTLLGKHLLNSAHSATIRARETKNLPPQCRFEETCPELAPLTIPRLNVEVAIDTLANDEADWLLD